YFCTQPNTFVRKDARKSRNLDNPAILVAPQDRLFHHTHAPDDSFSSEQGHHDEHILDIIVLCLIWLGRMGVQTMLL
ncbi:hypothetical protein BS47DRAFT_1351252, partial [Hydnum rufescens UP504]